MTNYSQIRNNIRQDQKLSADVIDNFIIYYAAQQDKVDIEFDKRLAKYRHVSKEFPQEITNYFKSQFIAHKIFKKGGLIKKYINRSDLRHLSEEKREFLQFQKSNPWKFSFGKILEQPEKDFFKMLDLFTGEKYLLLSPSMTDILEEQNPVMWFNLISFNGECRQTWGPVCAYNAFEPEDIFFFASEVNRGNWIEDGQELMEHVERNPIPYMLLMKGATLPMVVNGKDQVVQIAAEYLDDNFDSSVFGEEFSIGYSSGVYKIVPEGWGQHPHFASVYYDEAEQLLYLYSMTERGFRHLVDTLNRTGYDLSYEPDYRINMAMTSTASGILNKDYKLNRYDDLFRNPEPEEKEGELENLNALLAELIPYINNRQKPDLDALAAKFGTDPDTVKDLYEQVRKKVE